MEGCFSTAVTPVKELLYFYTSALNFLMVSTCHLLPSIPSRRHFDLPNRSGCSLIFLILLQVEIAENSVICSWEDRDLVRA